MNANRNHKKKSHKEYWKAWIQQDDLLTGEYKASGICTGLLANTCKSQNRSDLVNLKQNFEQCKKIKNDWINEEFT